MHGLHFNPEGLCTKIPSNPDQDARVSERLRLQLLKCEDPIGRAFAMTAFGVFMCRPTLGKRQPVGMLKISTT